MSRTVVNHKRGNRNLSHLPGDYGLPIFGKSFEFLKNPKTLFEEMYDKHGLVHRSAMYFERYIAMLGPEYISPVLMDKEKNFSSCNGWHKFIGRFFDRGLMLLDFDEHRLHRRAMQEAFKADALKGYCEMIGDVIDQHIPYFEDLTDKKEGEIYPLIKELTLDIANSVFIGVDQKTESENIKNAFVNCVEASLAIAKINLPFTSYGKGIASRKYLENYFRQQIPLRRGVIKKDLFSILCNLSEFEKEDMTDDDIVNHMIFLMMAAHDTTASAITNMLYELAKNPEWQFRLRRELGVFSDKTPEHHEMNDLAFTANCLKEVLRLYAPVRAIPRRAKNECMVNDIKVPANTYVWVCPEFTHRMPEYWTEPDKFDPDRFSPERAEHKSHPYAFFPYGAGAHKCIGMHFSEVVVKIAMSKLLNQFEFIASENYNPEYQIMPFPKPKDNLLLKVIKNDTQMQTEFDTFESSKMMEH